MSKNKLTKFILTCLMAIFIIGTMSMTAHAESVNEKEPNDTMETAQTIQANRVTAAQAVNNNRVNEYIVNGSASNTDEDWYKVYLSVGTQYVTCNAKSFEFEVYNSNGNTILEQVYIKTGFGSTAYAFTAQTEGYYYIKITGITSSPVSYRVLVGDPTYSYAACTVELDTIQMSNNQNRTSTFDLRFEDVLPDDAVVYSISMRGVGTTSVDSISVRNFSSNNTVNLPKYSWNQQGLVSLDMSLKSRWSITYGFNQNTSFTPSIKLDYAYPVVSENVEDNIVITP